MIHSYSKVYALGHSAIAELTNEPVLVQEKIDGSQFSFMRDATVNLAYRSKGVTVFPEAAGMFTACVEAVRSLGVSLTPNFVYRVEYVSKPRHNVLCYERTPRHYMIVFDIEDMNIGPCNFLPPQKVAEECARLGLEYVAPDELQMVRSMADLEAHMKKPSMLGGAREGVVLKNYCVTPDHKTLNGDLEWVEIGSLKVGDLLVASTEDVVGYRQGRAFRSSIVEHAERAQAEVFKIVLSDGSVLKCTANHPWLVRAPGKTDYIWRETSKLTGKELFKRVLPTWKTNKSYEAGYLAGIFDGEGHIIHRQSSVDELPHSVIEIGFSQNPGVVAEQSLYFLDKLGFKYGESLPGNSSANKYYLTGGKKSTLHFLGSIRPARLLSKVDIDRLGGLKSNGYEFLSIIKIESLGTQEIVELQTTSRTYLTDGFVSHNSRFTADGRVMMGKYVSEKFKESHMSSWKAANPGKGDVIFNLIHALKTEARYQKAAQHLRERGELTETVRDIGALIREVQSDVIAEEADRIKEALWSWARPQIERGVGGGVPQWYKDWLAAKQFASDCDFHPTDVVHTSEAPVEEGSSVDERRCPSSVGGSYAE